MAAGDNLARALHKAAWEAGFVRNFEEGPVYTAGRLRREVLENKPGAAAYVVSTVPENMLEADLQSTQAKVKVCLEELGDTAGTAVAAAGMAGKATEKDPGAAD